MGGSVRDHPKCHDATVRSLPICLGEFRNILRDGPPNCDVEPWLTLDVRPYRGSTPHALLLELFLIIRETRSYEERRVMILAPQGIGIQQIHDGLLPTARHQVI